MSKIQASIDSVISLDDAQLDLEIIAEIKSHLTIHNPQRAIALRELLWGADDLPKYLYLWKYIDNKLVLPRGFVFAFEKILRNYEIKIDWKTNLSINLVDMFDEPYLLRDYQSNAGRTIVQYAQGVYKAPTGSGKTRTMLAVIRECEQKTIVFVEKKDLLKQWAIAAEKFGFDYVGIIGDRAWEDDADLTIALRQSVWNKSEQLDKYWYDQFGMVVWDECHHAGADSSFELIQKFPAYYRFGCSATPDSDPARWDLVKAVIGPIVADTSPEQASEALVIPSIKVVDTEFNFDYHPTEKVDNKVIRNNYNSMMKALEEDEDRNFLIIGYAVDCAANGHKCIVLSKRKNHLKNLLKIYNENYAVGVPTIFLTSDNSSESNSVKKMIESNYGSGGSILFSTLAEEGTDIPCLDRLFLTYPGRKTRGFEQAIGRIMRKSPGKKDAVVYDFCDKNIGLLKSQFRERSQKIYGAKGYKIEFLNR